MTLLAFESPMDRGRLCILHLASIPDSRCKIQSRRGSVANVFAELMDFTGQGGICEKCQKVLATEVVVV